MRRGPCTNVGNWATVLTAAVLVLVPARAQWWDGAAECANMVSGRTGGKFTISFEFRSRYEDKNGVNFGKDPDLSYALVRTRFGLAYKPVSWLKFSGMLQDSRAPVYGNDAPSTVRDPADLQEGYVELFPDEKTGFGLTAGRKMVTYGEGRLIGIPDWTNLSRTYDHARAYYRFARARLEMLYVSPVKINLNGFNSPVLGNHVWGTYDVFPNLFGKNSLDAYILRHGQNRPGGFTAGSKAAGTDRLGTMTYGFRIVGQVAYGVEYGLEGAFQSGEVGAAKQRGSAWVSRLSRQFKISGKTLDTSGEYKFASGTKNPGDTNHVRTFDQLYAANHDRFGRTDLFGWRNLVNLRSLETLGLTKDLAINFMYNDLWLAQTRDGLYNSQGSVIAQSPTGAAGRHVGQETDVFATYKIHHWLFGAGYSYLFKGEFIQHATHNVSPSYAYVFQSYSF